MQTGKEWVVDFITTVHIVSELFAFVEQLHGLEIPSIISARIRIFYACAHLL